MKDRMILLLSGLSGSGKSTALNILEDAGFYSVDNLPGALFPQLLDLLEKGRALSHLKKVALVMDARERGFVKSFERYFEILRSRKIRHRIVFFDARNDVLVRRYSETRRRHPLAPLERASVGVRKERALLTPVREAAHDVIDTTYADIRELRRKVLGLVRDPLPGRGRRRPSVTLVSFGYRHGLPLEADLVFDVRSLPNPHFVPALKPFSGKNKRVARFVLGKRETKALLKPVRSLMRLTLRQSVAEGKSYLHVAFGCTGGRHRSVAVAEALAKDLNRWGYAAKVLHRDLNREA